MTDHTYSEKDAIQAALNHQWKEAISINTSLLKTDKNNINILNRLGFAYLQTGQLTAAKKTFQKVTKIDEYNQIAIKNLKKLTTVRQKDLVRNAKTQLSPMLFLEEPGKTKIVECVNTAPIVTLSCVSPGEQVVLHAKNHVVEIRTDTNVYLGALPDDLSFRIIKFLDGGNTYLALVKSVAKNSLTIFVRELIRGKRFQNQPSFASNTVYIPVSKIDRGEDETEESPEAATEEET
jgi:tetratricopeptide (TPR) repeat protein